ncbi:MAG: cob(I)yrinic acid a,c-diamide adenosyltransferase [Paramuribaculum sp.]|nr:cob(I)yrinic acid a,c-diamide adenosyltransferase [Paramuribaculum sp.]
MKKSNLYTATGDKGTTSLVGGARERKDSPRIEAYGTIDSLNSHIGLLRSLTAADELTTPMLHTVQCRLFDIGTALATPGQLSDTPPVSENDIKELETYIDTVDSHLPALNSFVLPTGTPAAAQAHVARTECRRAERLIVALSRTIPIHPQTLIYLNRLSDLLFAIARFNNINARQPEIFWSKNC